MFALFKKTVLYITLAYALIGFIILPLVLKPQIIKLVPEFTNANIEIDGIYFNPFIFKLELSGVRLKSLADEELVSFSNLLINVELYSLLNTAVHVKSVILSSPKISLIYNKDKSINLLNIIKKTQAKKEDTNSTTTIPRIIVDKVSIQKGTIAYEDFTQATPFEFAFEHIGFTLKDIDTDDFNSSSAQMRLYSTLDDGGFVDFKSKVIGFKPFIVEGSLDFEASKLYTQWKYMKERLKLEVADGKISFHTEYRFNIDELNETKIDNLNVSLERLRVKPKDKSQDILNLDLFYIHEATIFPFKQSVVVQKIAIDGLKIKAQRSKEKSIDWIEYTKLAVEEGMLVDENISTPTQTTETKPWNVLVKDIALEEISFNFIDKGINPAVTTDINKLNIYAKELTLAGEKPFAYSIDILLNKKAKCNLFGEIIHKNLDISSHVECRDFNIVHYRPYIDYEARKALKVYNVKLQSAEAAFRADLSLRDEDGEIIVKVEDANLSVKKLRLNKRSTARRILGFKSFDVVGVNVDTKVKSVDVKKVALYNLYAKVKKHKDGSLNLENLIEAKEVSKKKQVISKEKPFDIKLKKVSLIAASVRFEDDSLEKSTTNRIDGIYFNAYNVNPKKYSWLSYNLAMRVNAKGTIKAKGNLRHTPLKQSGSFKIKNISLKELTPYLQEQSYISIEDGKLSLEGRTKYQKSSKDADLRVKGSVGLNSLFVNDTLHKSLLLSLNELKLHSYTFELNPNRLHIDEVDINSFYVDAKIDENKTMNFSELMKKSDENITQEVEAEVSEVEDANSSFPYSILKVDVTLGSAKFADYSIPLKFSTHIHDLNGAIYSISNAPGDTTYVDITGEIDKYASTRLKGSIDSSNPKAYTDLDFNFKNLDLGSFSGYSANFAGHEIESGKLYLDLGYDILDSELLGKNVIMIKQLKLGKEVEDENITVLPLGFVIGLLEDNEGVIDIDMPVEGNLDNPDFKYGTLILKTFGNLIVKAVTSPFKFLSSAMGMDGDALEFIAFEPGATLISPPQREKLDKIAKMMLKKPKISLGVSGVYNAKSDKSALQLVKLRDLAFQMSDQKNIKENENIMSIDLLEDIYDEMGDDTKLEALQDRLSKEYEDEAYERAYFNELVDMCREVQPVTQEELVALAKQRAETIVSYLVQDKMVESTRVSEKEMSVVEDARAEFVNVNMEIEVK